MNEGGFGRRTSDAKVRILREKCLRILENFSKRIGSVFGENVRAFIGVWPASLGERGSATWLSLWARFLICV